MWKETLRDLLIIAAFIMMICGTGVMIDKRPEGFEATVTFFLLAILSLLRAQMYGGG